MIEIDPLRLDLRFAEIVPLQTKPHIGRHSRHGCGRMGQFHKNNTQGSSDQVVLARRFELFLGRR